MKNLNPYDLQWTLKHLPKNVLRLMQRNELTLGGGFIRACIERSTINDVDLFLADPKEASSFCDYLNAKKRHHSGNAITCRIPSSRYPIQFITRWQYNQPQDVLPSFDFTICQAIIWWDHYNQRWCSGCCDSFYQDLAAKRLVYTNPQREEEPGGSFLRILKFYQKGYRIPLKELASVITRLVSTVSFSDFMLSGNDARTVINQDQFHKVILGLLYEVDPNTLPQGYIED